MILKMVNKCFVGTSVLLKNNKPLLKIVKKESPEAYYEWTLNGIFIKPEPDRISIHGDNIELRNLKPTDSGLYVCMLYRINKRRVVFRVISVAVKSKKFDLVTRATRSFTLSCNAVILGKKLSHFCLNLKQPIPANHCLMLFTLGIK